MRRFLVTGASSGIGAAACRRLARPGTCFLVHTRGNLDGAAQVVRELEARGAQARVAAGDLGDPLVPARLVDTATSAFGGLDVVIANAGFADRTGLVDLDPERFDRSMAAITRGFLGLARAAHAPLAAGSDARIVAVGSFVAHSFRTDGPVFLASAAAKAAVEALVRGLAVELGPDRITVNCVVPGAIEKDPGRHTAMTEAQWRASVARIPLGRLGRPDDVAAAIAFLCAPEAGYVTGQALHVNGGLVI
jgi:NAD(P)-dependent dehydrogenase (short-subunit alcohol dehydrogenase family)